MVDIELIQQIKGEFSLIIFSLIEDCSFELPYLSLERKRKVIVAQRPNFTDCSPAATTQNINLTSSVTGDHMKRLCTKCCPKLTNSNPELS